MEHRRIGGVSCLLDFAASPECLLIQPCGAGEVAELEAELSAICADARPFSAVFFAAEDWNRDLSPWAAPPVFGKTPFGCGAADTLAWITESLLPELPKAPVVLGGYSLAGLFSLWCGYQSNLFQAIAAVSPSVWFPGWIEFARLHRCLTPNVYLSLGDLEHRSRNPVLSTVHEAILMQDRLLERDECAHQLEWNPGNHFRDAPGRTALGFRWAMHSLAI